jgi:hypothetical protein
MSRPALLASKRCALTEARQKTNIRHPVPRRPPPAGIVSKRSHAACLSLHPDIVTLPLHFDTAAVWRTIVRGALVGVAVIAGAALVAAIDGKLAAAAQLSLTLLVCAFVARRVKGVPMGAIGTITATAVTTEPATAFGIRLAVPVGRFPLARFRSILVEERTVLTSTSGDPRVGRVYLVGDGDLPRIHVFVGKVDDARRFASDLCGLLGIGMDPARA